MSRYTTLILLFQLLTAQQFVKAQNYDLNWTLSNGMLLDFRQDETKVLPFNVKKGNIISCTSDYNGNLALILGLSDIYDSNGNSIYKFNSKSRIKPMALLPQPGMDNQYVCVYMVDNSKLYYLILEKKEENITIITLPTLLASSSYYDPFYSAIVPSTSGGFWFFASAYGQNQLHAFHLSTGGWDAKVVSTGAYGGVFGSTSDISRDGRFITCLGTIDEVSPATGKAIRQISLPKKENIAFQTYGFSPSGKWIYVQKQTSLPDGSNTHDFVRYQSKYLLGDYEPDHFLASEEQIYRATSSFLHKLAPDNNIYIGEEKLLRIRNPDADLHNLIIEEVAAFSTSFPVVVNARPTLIPQTINCTDVKLRCIGEGIKNYSWNFGDGSPHMQTTIPDVWYRYTKSGTYRVTLTVEWLTGKTYSLQQEVIVPECKPALNFVSDGACVEQEIRFSTKSTNIKSLIWHFGDGDTSTSINPTHTYKAAGRYTVKLTVIYNDKTTETTEKQITIHAKPKISAIQF